MGFRSTLSQHMIEREFDRTFGGERMHGTVYWDPLRGTNLLPKMREAHKPVYEALQKHLDAGMRLNSAFEAVAKSLGSSDWTLPIFPLRDLFENAAGVQTPVADLIPRIAWRYKTVNFDNVNALGSAKWKSEGATPDQADDTYDPVEETQKYAYTKGEVTGQMQLFGGQVRNVLQTDQAQKFKQIRILEEDTILNGNPTAANVSGGPLDEQAYTGLRERVVAGNDIDAATVDISKALFRKAVRKIWNANGQAKLAITDATTYDAFKAILEQDVRHIDVTPATQFTPGIDAYSFDGVTFVKSPKMPDTDLGREILLLDASAWGLYTGLDAAMEPLAKTKDADEYMVKAYETLAVHADKRIARVKNYAVTA